MAKPEKKNKTRKDKKDKKKSDKTKKQGSAKPQKQSKDENAAIGEVKAKTASLSKGIRKGDQLADLRCVPCRGGVPPLGKKEIAELLPKLKGWKAVDGHHLEKEVKFSDFAQALDFTIEVGELAEVEQHHPDLYLAWGKVGIKIWTHKIDGLTESDFVLAAKIDLLT
jgi:4a-hydroxytetrahydrobiopterin dehydratase